MQSASKAPIVGRAALEALEGVTQLRVAYGKRVLDVPLTTNRPTDDELLALLLGRSGKLRAPTIKVGTELLVGYSQELLSSALL